MGATRSLENSTFGAIPRGSGAFAADGLSFTHTRHTWSQRCSSPSAAGAALSRLRIRFHRSPATFTLSWTPPANTNLSPHPLGFLELAVRPYRHHGQQWLRRTVRSTWRALTAIFYSQGAQQPLTPGLSGVGLASPPI